MVPVILMILNTSYIFTNFNVTFCYLLNQNYDCVGTKMTNYYYPALYHKYFPDNITHYQLDLYPSWADIIDYNSFFLHTDRSTTIWILQQMFGNRLSYSLSKKNFISGLVYETQLVYYKAVIFSFDPNIFCTKSPLKMIVNVSMHMYYPIYIHQSQLI